MEERANSARRRRAGEHARRSWISGIATRLSCAAGASSASGSSVRQVAEDAATRA
jgi:hypothetical protein